MKFFVDAQLPLVLKRWLISQGFDTIHSNDLPLRNCTPDIEIINLATEQDRIIISKDSDFFKFYLLNGIPKRMLMVTTGNIINKELIKLFELNFPKIQELFEKGFDIIEIDNFSIYVHQK